MPIAKARLSVKLGLFVKHCVLMCDCVIMSLDCNDRSYPLEKSSFIFILSRIYFVQMRVIFWKDFSLWFIILHATSRLQAPISNQEK